MKKEIKQINNFIEKHKKEMQEAKDADEISEVSSSKASTKSSKSKGSKPSVFKAWSGAMLEKGMVYQLRSGWGLP